MVPAGPRSADRRRRFGRRSNTVKRGETAPVRAVILDGVSEHVALAVVFALLAAFLYALSNVLEQGVAETMPDRARPPRCRSSPVWPGNHVG